LAVQDEGLIAGIHRGASAFWKMAAESRIVSHARRPESRRRLGPAGCCCPGAPARPRGLPLGDPRLDYVDDEADMVHHRTWVPPSPFSVPSIWRKGKSRTACRSFCPNDNVSPGSTIYTDGLKSFAGLPEAGFKHISRTQPLRSELRKVAKSAVPLVAGGCAQEISLHAGEAT
jgi:hypothetical protein